MWCFVISWHIGLQLLCVFHLDWMVNNSLFWCSLKMFAACVSLQGKINHFKEIRIMCFIYFISLNPLN
jgi:hypothetical protein